MKRLICTSLLILAILGCAMTHYERTSLDGSRIVADYRRLWTSTDELTATVGDATVTSKGQKITLTPEEAAKILNALITGK